jgi:hypothetical protein
LIDIFAAMLSMAGPMTLDDFRTSLSRPSPPEGLHVALQVLWWAGKGEWDKAHKIVQDEAGGDAAWIHAYLHRVEGDLPNARYWYGQAGQPPATGALEDEWEAIVRALLEHAR